MPTVYIKQLKHYSQGGIRGSGEGNYTVKCVNYHLKNMSLINLLTLHIHFKYVLTNFVTLPTPQGNASSHLPTLQASTECVNSCGHLSDPNSINMQSSGFVISWTYSQNKDRNVYQC